MIAPTILLTIEQLVLLTALETLQWRELENRGAIKSKLFLGTPPITLIRCPTRLVEVTIIDMEEEAIGSIRGILRNKGSQIWTITAAKEHT